MRKTNGLGWSKALPSSVKLDSSAVRLSKKEVDELLGAARIKPKVKVLTTKGKK
jgi:hypothetical protein